MSHRSAPVHRRASRTPRPLSALLLPLVLLLTGCATGGGDSAAEDTTGPASSSRHGEHPEASSGTAHAADPSTVLLRPADLPAGYLSGHGHTTPPTGDEPTPAGCKPLADLLRRVPADGHEVGHAAGHATTHRQHEAAAVSFTKSHVGPTITQTVVDLGAVAPAAAEVRRVEAAATECPTYVQSTSRTGLNTYRVAALTVPADAEPGAYLRLTTTGTDGGAGSIHWDLWVHACEGMLVAVTFRSALGGDNADFWPAVVAAMRRVHDA